MTGSVCVWKEEVAEGFGWTEGGGERLEVGGGTPLSP